MDRLGEDRLSAKDWGKIGIEAFLNLIPVGGGTLATMVFGPGNAKKAKRLERVIKNLRKKLEVKVLSSQAIWKRTRKQ